MVYDPFYTRIAQTFRQAVQVHRPVAYQKLSGRFDMVPGHRLALRAESPDAFQAERVCQPGLATGEFPDPVDSLRRESLSRVGKMLSYKDGDLVAGKVGQGG